MLMPCLFLQRKMLSPKTQNLLRNIFVANGGSPLAGVHASVSAIPLGVIRFSFLALGNAITGLGFVVFASKSADEKGDGACASSPLRLWLCAWLSK